jgi:hypothetical protein
VIFVWKKARKCKKSETKQKSLLAPKTIFTAGGLSKLNPSITIEKHQPTKN